MHLYYTFLWPFRGVLGYATVISSLNHIAVTVILGWNFGRVLLRGSRGDLWPASQSASEMEDPRRFILGVKNLRFRLGVHNEQGIDGQRFRLLLDAKVREHWEACHQDDLSSWFTRLDSVFLQLHRVFGT